MNETKRKKLLHPEIKLPRYMLGTKAYHQLGDISRDEPDLCYIERKEGKYYTGSWVTGYGFFNVKFPVETTRVLSDSEIARYNKQYIQLADHPPQKLNVG